MMRRALIGLAVVVLSASASTAKATMLSLDATGEGWCNITSGCNNTNTSIIQNTFAGYSDSYRDWFAFDLAGVTGTVTAATIQIWNDYENQDFTSAIYNLYQAPSINYGSLQNGPSLGSIPESVADTGVSHYVAIGLNAAGNAALTGGEGGVFVFGGTNPGNQLFGYTNGFPRAKLDITTSDGLSPVPEPASLMLVGTGLVGLVGLARRRKSVK